MYRTGPGTHGDADSVKSTGNRTGDGIGDVSAGRSRRLIRSRVQAVVVGMAFLIATAAALPGLESSTSADQSTRAGRSTRGNLSTPPYVGYREEGYPAISTPNTSLSMAFVTPGIVDEIAVEENDRVEPGDLLVRLDDSVQRATVEAQKLIMDDDSELKAAQRRHELSQFELTKILEAADKGSKSPREVERATVEEALRAIEVDAAELNREQARIVYKREKARMDQMTLHSTISGVVVRIETDEGEAIDSHQAALHLVSIDPLWMDLAVPVALGLRLKKGDIGVVQWRDVNTPAPYEGRVLFVSPVADAASNSIVCRVEVDNPGPDPLPAGLHAFVSFPEIDEVLMSERGR
jgi:RND family efflux transporter MFP subunit